MRLPAYGKALLKLREQGAAPWVVVIAVGHLIDAQTLKGQPGVARIGLPFDLPLDRTDLSLLVGLDVLVSLFAPASVSAADRRILHARAIAAIAERGEPGQLWAADPASAYASPLQRSDGARGVEYVTGLLRIPLDAHFRDAFAWWRKCALLGGEGLFARPQFNPVREQVLRELCHDHAAA
jgi:hypothetical protein